MPTAPFSCLLDHRQVTHDIAQAPAKVSWLILEGLSLWGLYWLVTIFLLHKHHNQHSKRYCIILYRSKQSYNHLMPIPGLSKQMSSSRISSKPWASVRRTVVQCWLCSGWNWIEVIWTRAFDAILDLLRIKSDGWWSCCFAKLPEAACRLVTSCNISRYRFLMVLHSIRLFHHGWVLLNQPGCSRDWGAFLLAFQASKSDCMRHISHDIFILYFHHFHHFHHFHPQTSQTALNWVCPRSGLPQVGYQRTKARAMEMHVMYLYVLLRSGPT